MKRLRFHPSSGASRHLLPQGEKDNSRRIDGRRRESEDCRTRYPRFRSRKRLNPKRRLKIESDRLDIAR